MAKKQSTKFPYKEITLTWVDATSDPGWLSYDEMKNFQAQVCCTQGWVFEETKDYIKVFGTYSINKETNEIDFGEVICIPSKWLV